MPSGQRAEARGRGGLYEVKNLSNALAAPPSETVIAGEMVALDVSGSPSFNALRPRRFIGCAVLTYAEGSKLAAVRMSYLFRGGIRHKVQLTDQPMHQSPVYRILGRRCNPRVGAKIGRYSFPPHHAVLPNVGKLAVAQQKANRKALDSGPFRPQRRSDFDR